MSPSVHYVKRTTGAGVRWYVRFRVGGRESRLRHAGTAHTIKERDALIQRVRISLAENGDFAPVAERPDPRLLATGRAYLASRVDVSPRTRDLQRGVLEQVAAELGREAPLDTLTAGDVSAWIARLHAAGKKRSTINLRLVVLRQILDFAGIEPNPARHRSVRLPHEPREEIQPPTGKQFALLLEFTPVKHRLPLELLEATGLRISELARLTWGDVDVAGCRFRVAGGKTQAARRWVPVDPSLLARLPERGDQEADARVLGGLVANSVAKRMALACQLAGIPHFHPHDLRHRYISKLVQSGVPITKVKELAGHSKASITLDVYSHVLLED